MLCCFQPLFSPPDRDCGERDGGRARFFFFRFFFWVCFSAPDGRQQGPSGDKEEGVHAGPLGAGDKVTFSLSLRQTGWHVTG